MSGIEWTTRTWNPLTGCTKISPGCKNCYAERMSHRLKAMNNQKYRNGFNLTMHPKNLLDPLSWRKPSKVFVNSMSDLFHDEVPDHFILSVFEIMGQAAQHQYQVLTKRPARVVSMNAHLNWLPNIWLGASVESKDYVERIDAIRATGAAVKFLSLEPLLGALPDLDLTGIDWVIVGGESGPRARPVKESWILDIRDQCRRAGAAFFFKQWGGVNKKKTGRLLQGRQYDEMPHEQ